MARDIQQLKMFLHTQHLSALNLYRFASSVPFEEAFTVATIEEKELAEKIIKDGDKIELIEWTKMVLRKNRLIEVLDVRYLRTLGRDLGIRNYATLSRLTLIATIHQYLESKNGKGNTGTGNHTVTQ